MSFDLTVVATEQLAITADLPTVIVFPVADGKSYSVIASDLTKSAHLEYEGLMTDFDRSFSWVKTIFGSDAMPTYGNSLLCGGDEYIVERVVDSVDGVTRTVFCKSKEG